jgi:hypothetical protein
MGDYIVCPGHVQQLISTVSKEKHFLTKNDLQPEDKMNFLAAEKVCSPDVIRLLEGIPESEATRAYLNLISPRADDEFGEGILGNQKFKKMYYLNVSESGIDSR